jgi:hypothetical protein
MGPLGLPLLISFSCIISVHHQCIIPASFHHSAFSAGSFIVTNHYMVDKLVEWKVCPDSKLLSHFGI